MKDWTWDIQSLTQKRYETQKRFIFYFTRKRNDIFSTNFFDFFIKKILVFFKCHFLIVILYQYPNF